MEFNTGNKVNVTLNDQQKAKLGIQSDIKNPCTIVGKFTNSVDGYFVNTNDPTSKAQLGIPTKYLQKV